MSILQETFELDKTNPNDANSQVSGVVHAAKEISRAYVRSPSEKILLASADMNAQMARWESLSEQNDKLE